VAVTLSDTEGDLDIVCVYDADVVTVAVVESEPEELAPLEIETVEV
jgi:hypothetical protein